MPKKKQPEPDQNDPLLPRCLGWCGGRRFFPKLRFERYCPKCQRIKANRERDLSKRHRPFASQNSDK